MLALARLQLQLLQTVTEKMHWSIWTMSSKLWKQTHSTNCASTFFSKPNSRQRQRGSHYPNLRGGTRLPDIWLRGCTAVHSHGPSQAPAKKSCRRPAAAPRQCMDGVRRSSVPMCLVGVLWRLLGGSCYAALRLWCAWSGVGVGSMRIGTLRKQRKRGDVTRCCCGLAAPQASKASVCLKCHLFYCSNVTYFMLIRTLKVLYDHWL